MSSSDAEKLIALGNGDAALLYIWILKNRGVFARPTLYVLRKTQMPATLLEIGFITNSGDAALMYESPELFAAGIYNGILGYFGSS